MVGVFAKSPGGRAATRRSKHFLEDRVGIKRISPAAAVQNETPFDSFEPAELLEEPSELDHPVDCPSPEPSIMEDGILWRAKLLESLRRRNDILSASKERESVLRGGSIPNRRTYSRSSEHFLFVAHSAPEYDVRKLLE
ncbi:hypothetical protein M758_12G074400 [Ceratodon purpureus]|nr:hypothetical protein M758_12G074400 [Ceratodon purpureus]